MKSVSALGRKNNLNILNNVDLTANWYLMLTEWGIAEWEWKCVSLPRLDSVGCWRIILSMLPQISLLFFLLTALCVSTDNRPMDTYRVHLEFISHVTWK